ncbi:MAG: tetratricopeptide repeat protein [Bacteroidota bacterium]
MLSYFKTVIGKNNFLIGSTLFVLLLLSWTACNEAPELYQRTFSESEKKDIAKHMLRAHGFHYQGSAPNQFHMEEAWALDSLNADIIREIGIPYLKRGITAGFYPPYQEAIRLNARSWQGWRGYLYLYFYRDYERAIADFNAMDTLTPNFVDYPQATSVHLMRAVAYLKLKDYDECLRFLDLHIEEELKTATEDWINPRTWLYLFMAHWEKGDLAKAETSLRRGLKNRPDNADLWYWQAKLAVRQGQKSKAKAALEKAYDLLLKDFNNYRPYVEEFFQIYESDVMGLKEEILEM